MFTPNFYLDLLQTTKRGLTNKIFTDPTINKACHSFMAAQLELAKTITNNYIDLTAYSVESMSRVFYPKTVEETETKATSKVTKKTTA